MISFSEILLELSDKGSGKVSSGPCSRVKAASLGRRCCKILVASDTNAFRASEESVALSDFSSIVCVLVVAIVIDKKTFIVQEKKKQGEKVSGPRRYAKRKRR